jgi:hypothetical protein
MVRDPDSLPQDSNNFDEETLPERLINEITQQNWPTLREVHILDFKDGRSEVTVAHSPNDPSRVWLSLENDRTSISLSVEEGIARRLCESLGDVLKRFRDVRSAVQTGRLFP